LSKNFEYRPDIDGLRAISVIAVILFHAEIFEFKGGFLGVDIFFVISGYLISSIVLKEINNKNFSLINFYNRRARRILPVLIITILLTSLFSIPFMFPNEIEYLFKTNISIIFFFSNFFFWKNTDYFDDLTSQSPLLHTWSISVEEQFYILFPLLTIIFFKIKKQNLFLLLVLIIFLLSLFSSEILSKTHPDFNFFSTSSRVFEISLGVLLSFISQKNLLYKEIKYISKNSYSIIFFCVLILSFFIFDKHYNLPNSLTLIILICCSYFLICSNRETLICKLLSNKLMVILGKSSYSLYIFHYPVFVFLNLYNLINFKFLSIPILVIVSILSYKYIETPFRNKKKISNKFFYTLVFLSTIIIISLFYFKEQVSKTLKHDLYENEYYDLILNASNDKDKILTGNCKFHSREITISFLKNFEKCRKIHKKAILIIGDSHADDLFNSAVKNLNNESFILGVSKGGCPIYSEKTKCPYKDILEFYLNNKNNIKFIFFTQIGSDYLTNFNQLPVLHGNINLIIKYLESFKNDLSNIIWFGPQPEPRINMNNYKILRSLKSNNFSLYENNNIIHVDRKMKELAFINNIKYVSKIEAIDYKADLDFFHKKQFTYSDTDHFSEYGEEIFGQRLFKNGSFLKYYNK